MSSQADFDFIVVGAGPAGVVVASQLAKAATSPRVLLLEAGGADSSADISAAGERYTFWRTEEAAKFDYAYKSAPERELNNRELTYHRGHGLGGSTSINLGLWDYGRGAEMEEWARLVDDSGWGWNSTAERMKKIEGFHNGTPDDFRTYVNPNMERHGQDGQVDITLPTTWSPGLTMILERMSEHGFNMIPDLYSGSLGFGIPAATTINGLRVSADTAYLRSCPSNLIIKSNSRVVKVLFDGTKAIGVRLSNGDSYLASKEIIISAGAIDTPKLLLLSGIGPADELADAGICVTADVPCIGRNLRDHPASRISNKLESGFTPSLTVEEVKSWKSQWTKNRTGPLANDSARAVMGYVHVDKLSTFDEFQQLDELTQEFLACPETASIELILSLVTLPGTEMSSISTTIILMNPQSSGRVYLRSSDPNDRPVIELNYLQHPYDQRMFIEGVRMAMEFQSKLPFVGHLSGPKSPSDKGILDFLRRDVTPAFHALGTVKMGETGDSETCVDSDCRVVGVQNLRVVDMSVCPVVPSNHTQSTAYLIGDVAAEKLIKEYQL